MKMLLADDDPYLQDVTTYALRREGFTVLAATDGQQALRQWETGRPDIVLLDVNMPKLNGFEVCRQIRQASETPIIMLTAASGEDDIVRGLQLGADDYVTQRFSPRQLAARMHAVLRRTLSQGYDRPARDIRVGDLVLDVDSHEVTKGGALVQLTPLEFRILHLLAMNEGRVIPYARLVEHAWGYEGGDSYLLKTHIYHLRRKLALPPKGPGGIRAVSGVGYSLMKGVVAPAADRP